MIGWYGHKTYFDESHALFRFDRQRSIWFLVSACIAGKKNALLSGQALSKSFSGGAFRGITL